MATRPKRLGLQRILWEQMHMKGSTNYDAPLTPPHSHMNLKLNMNRQGDIKAF